jgi:hypothetical protein
MTLRALILVLVSILMSATLLTLAGCAGSADVRPERGPTPARATKEPATRSVIVPCLAAQPGTLLAQRKGDLSATLLPVACQVNVVEHREARKATGLGSSLAGKQRYLTSTRERAEFDPDFFTFRIALTDVGADALSLPPLIVVEYRINGVPAEATRTWGPCRLGNEIAPGDFQFVRFDLPHVGDLQPGDQVLVALRGLPTRGGAKTEPTDFVWNLTIAAERTIELKNSTGSEWR